MSVPLALSPSKGADAPLTKMGLPYPTKGAATMGVMSHPARYYYCDWNVTVKAPFLNTTVVVPPAARRGL